MEYITLNNGLKMPMLGYGTYLTPASKTEELVSLAIKNGYRLIDTAQNYGNEHEVGLAVKKCGLPREEIFVTSKTQTSGYESTKREIEVSLRELGLDYIDLMIIHWPNGDSLETYKALVEAYKQGKIKAIGLSNFNQNQVEEIISNFDVVPAINQIETHILWQQKKMHDYLNSKSIVHESWSPFCEGVVNIFSDSTLKSIGNKYAKTSAQVILRFLVQRNIVVIPKTTKEIRMKENIDIFDFELSEEDMQAISSLDKKQSVTGWPSSMLEESRY